MGIIEFLKDFDHEIDCAVFGLPGPVINGAIDKMVDIPSWGSISEEEIS